MTPLIHIKNLLKTRNKRGLLDIDDFEIPTRNCIVLSGRNGAGKTTLLKILAGLEPPDSADIYYQGKCHSWKTARNFLRANVVYLHQQPYMFDRSVAENIAYGIKKSGLTKAKVAELTDQALSWAGLSHLSGRNARHLSGGEKQRVALTRARILKPKLLLLDEPVTNMDLESREKTITLIQRLKFEGISTIVTSHEPNFARLLSNDHRHLCKTGPSRYTVVEPFLYEGYINRQRSAANSLSASPYIQLANTAAVLPADHLNQTRPKPANTQIHMTHQKDFSKKHITAVILAGGRAQRMGGTDKGLLPLQGKPMIEHIIKALSPQVEHIIINANRNLERYQEYGYPVVTDIIGEYFGPLVGMASGIQHADTDYVVTVPCDSPLLPDNLVQTLFTSLQNDNAELAVAHDGDRMQPVFALLRCDLLPDLLNYLNDGGRKIDTWYAQHQTALADFSKSENAFMNVNSPDEKSLIEKYLNDSELTL